MYCTQVEHPDTADHGSRVTFQNSKPSISLSTAHQKLNDIVALVSESDPTNAGYVTKGTAACILEAVHKISELVAKGEPDWGGAQHLLARDDGRNMSLERIKPWFEFGSRPRACSTSKKGMGTSTHEALLEEVPPIDQSCPQAFYQPYMNPASPFLPNRSLKKPKSLINRLEKAAEKERNKENIQPPPPIHGTSPKKVTHCVASTAKQAPSSFAMTKGVPHVPIRKDGQPMCNAQPLLPLPYIGNVPQNSVFLWNPWLVPRMP